MWDDNISKLNVLTTCFIYLKKNIFKVNFSFSLTLACKQGLLRACNKLSGYIIGWFQT